MIQLWVIGAVRMFEESINEKSWIDSDGLFCMITSYERGVPVMGLGQERRECRAMEQTDDPFRMALGFASTTDVTTVTHTARLPNSRTFF